MEKTSCIQHEPLSKLDENGSASILNYNLPQSTTYEVFSYIKLDIPETLFKNAEKKAPPVNSAVSHHAQTADTQRQVEVNTDVTAKARRWTATTSICRKRRMTARSWRTGSWNSRWR